MSEKTPGVAIACNATFLKVVETHEAIEYLRDIADVRMAAFARPEGYIEAPPSDPAEDARLIELIGDATAVIVSMGAPRITAQIMDACPNLRFIGELEGDRFANRIDTEAAWARGIRTVDTTNGSSYGVAEWALMMMILGLRNGSEQYRGVMGRAPWFHSVAWDSRAFIPRELTGRTVGMIGCGIVGRRLLELLAPFGCDIYIHDPYVPRELGDIYDVTFTSLDRVLEQEVIVCLAPITPATKGMIGREQIARIRDGSCFVNVSRGQIVDSAALIERLKDGRITACLDVFDPEPFPEDSPIRDLPNVFATPHAASAAQDGRGRNVTIMVEELERFFEGHETRYDLLPRTIANRTGAEAPKRV
ncbi:MAG: NAD(P)-dependent oxidoreductase [Chloroflexota bacterium]